MLNIIIFPNNVNNIITAINSNLSLIFNKVTPGVTVLKK